MSYGILGNLEMQLEWLLLGGLCFLPVLFLIIGVVIAIWVYRDAESRGMSGVLWLIVCLVAGIIGLIIYFVLRKPKLSEQHYSPPGSYPPPPVQYPPPGQYPPPPPPGYYPPPPPR